MNKLIAAFVMTAMSSVSFAAQSDHVLKCEEAPFANVWVYLDASSLSEDASSFRVQGATITFNYSSTISMACSERYYKKDLSEEMSCAGYYYSHDFTTLQLVPEDGKVYVEWQTSEVYGQQKFKTECQLTRNPSHI